MQIFIETDRFILREIVPEDAAGLFELDSDPDVHRYLGNKPLTDMEQARTVIQMIRKQYEENGIGRWAVVDKSTGAFTGWSGLKLVRERTNGHIDYYDLGYRFIKRFWGRGIATETAQASLVYAFDQLNLSEVFGMADCENAASNRILAKVGLRFVESFDLEGVRHHWYRISREEFDQLQAKY